MSVLSDLIRKKKHTFCTAVVVAAGSSQRMGTDKMLMDIAGIPVLARTLMAIDSFECVDEIILVARLERVEEFARLCDKYGIKKVTSVICGGAVRTESALAGVTAADSRAELVAIHDGARPFITEDVFYRALHAAALHTAAAPAVSVCDTIKTAVGGIVSGTPDRNSLFAVQTPQVFRTDVIKGALTKALAEDAVHTDDCAAVEALGVPVHLVQGARENIKITEPLDVFLAEAVLRSRGELQ